MFNIAIFHLRDIQELKEYTVPNAIGICLKFRCWFVTVDGLPTSSYVAGKTYNFPLTITHGAANRKRWGFSIEARNSSGQNISSFASNNPHVAINGNELSHFEAQIFKNPSASYTYDSLVWTVPSFHSSADKEVTFYYVGNGANGDGRGEGD